MTPTKFKYNDAKHVYTLDGKRAKGVTTVSKIPDDTFALEQWGNRQVAIGMATSPELVEQVAAHFDDRNKVNEFCKQAMTYAKAHAKADRGTAMHRATDRADKGEDFLKTDLLADTVAAWNDTLDRYGYDVEPGCIERFVIWPEQRICGRFDRLVRCRDTGRLHILDLKSGERALKYPHSIAIQLALYAHAPVWAAEWEGDSGETTEFEEPPHGIDPDIGLVLHMPTPAEAEIYRVDIAAGIEIAQTAVFAVLDWRNRDDLVLPAESQPVVEAVEAPDGVSRAVWVADRVGVLPDKAKQQLARRWPTDTPTPKAMLAARLDADVDYTDTELAAIETVLAPIEDNHRAPFTVDPTAEPDNPRPVIEANPQPAVEPPDEGRQMEDADIDAIQQAANNLEGVDKETAQRWMHQMQIHGGLDLHGVRSERRFQIARALIGLASYDDDVARAAISMAIGDEVQPAVVVGDAFLALTIDEAGAVCDLVAALAGNHIKTLWDDDGACRLVPA